MEPPQKRVPGVYLVDVRSTRLKEKLAEEIVSVQETIPTCQNPPQITPVNSVVVTQLPQTEPKSPSTVPTQVKRVYKHIDSEDREIIIEMSQNGYSRKEISKCLKISYSSVSRIIVQSREGILKDGQRGGARNVKLTPDASKLINDSIIENPIVTVAKLTQKLNEHNFNVTESCVSKHMNHGGMEKHGYDKLTLKKVCVIGEARNSDTVKEQRINYIKHYLSIKTQGIPIIFIDESPWKVRVYNRYGRSKKGTPCIVEAPTERIENIVAIAAISNIKGVEQVDIIRGTVDATVFKNFIFKLLSKLTEPTALVMDNVRFHHDISIIDNIKEHGHYILFTATSSCELNPIEYVFSIWKSNVRSVEQKRSILEVINELSKGFVDIQPRLVRKCIQHVEEKLFPIALQKGNLQLKDTVKEFKILTSNTNSNETPVQREIKLNNNEITNENQKVFMPFPKPFTRKHTQINTQNDISESESSITLGFMSQFTQSSHLE